MSKIVMTQALCDAGYEPLAKEGPIYVANNGNPSEYPEEMKDAECIVVRIGHMNRAEIEAAPRLRVIGRSGIGYDSIDITAANEHGIPVVIAPHCNADSVAEHTLALMFALASNIVECHNEAVKGNFEIRNSGKTFELQGLTVGIVGFGDIGKRVGRLCRAVGMRLMAYDPYCSAEDMETQGAVCCQELSELLSNSDIVTIHTPLNDETRGLLGLEQLRQMKPTALLINCARGGIVDEAALIRALEEEHLSCPWDVSVTGYDDSYLATSCKVPLTTIAHPQEKLGKMAAELLLKLMQEEAVPPEQRQIRIEPELIIRDSCRRL